MARDFLNRALPIFSEAGFKVLQEKLVAFAGLGGVGGGAFLALVRCGVTRFRLAENGVFDPPDMNRQAAAFGHTMDRSKLDIYVELARSINPDVELELYPEGTNEGSIEQFLAGADLHVGVIDVEKGAEVKAMTPGLLEKYNVPMFTCGAIGFGALLVAHEPRGMMPDEFWSLVSAKSDGGALLPSYLGDYFNQPVMERIAEGYRSGILPTTAIGGMASNTLLACEVLTCMLQDTGLVDRKPVYAPEYVVVDFLGQNMVVGDVTKD
jgi:hypothetical protein